MSLPLYNRPYVEFDFTRMAFDTRVSFSRSSTGTYFDAAGVMQTAASNVPRKEHDPVTGTVRGLLMEEQRTNRSIWSQDFSVGKWTTSKTTGATVTADTTLAPDGTTTADTLVLVGAGDYLYRPQNSYPAVAGQSAVFSCHTKHVLNGFVTWGGASPLGTTTYSTETLAGGWYRLSVSRTFTETTSAKVLQLIIGGSIAATAGTFTIWGAQLEAGTYPTSYIPTTTATATRSADVATFTIPARVVRLVTIYDDGTTSQQAVTPGASYTIPTGQKPILRIRGYFA